VFHHVATTQHIGSDFEIFLSPVNQILLQPGAIQSYYAGVGEEIGKFVDAYRAALRDLSQYWDFDKAPDFGKVLNEIFYVTKDNTTRLNCALEMWVWAYQKDRWDTQRLVNQMLQHIPAAVEHDFAADILGITGKLVNGEQLRGVTMSQVIRNTVNQLLDRK
jgi:hypothetical protein